MVRHFESKIASTSPAAPASILDLCDNEIYSDDDGALLGQLSMLRAGLMVERHDNPRWHEAVSVALSVH